MRTKNIFLCCLICALISNVFSYGQKGVLRIEISGIPAGVESNISVKGPKEFSRMLSRSESFNNLQSGTYEFTSEIIIKRQPFISQAYRLDKLASKVVVKNDTQQVNLIYKLMPGSQKLWMGNSSAKLNTSTRILAFDKDALNVTQSSNAAIKLTEKVTSPKGVVFDSLGNLWLADAYSIKMFEWNTLENTKVLPKVVLALNESPSCIAFDTKGNLWFSNGKKIGSLFRIPKDKLFASGKPMPDIVLSGNGISGIHSIAFDIDGNLWANHEESKAIIKIGASSLSNTSNEVEAQVIISCKSKPPVVVTLGSPKALAFDKEGNLYAAYYGGNTIAKIPAGQLISSGAITPEAQIILNVAALLHSIAFDENGGLWTALSEGKFGRLSPEQLNSGGKLAPEIVITGSEVGYTTGLAFYPIPYGLPLN